jgi:hypothetical protein
MGVQTQDPAQTQASAAPKKTKSRDRAEKTRQSQNPVVQTEDDAVEVDDAVEAEDDSSQPKTNSTNRDLRDQINAQKRVEIGLEGRIKKLERQLEQRAKRETTIRNEVEMEILHRHQDAADKLEEARKMSFDNAQAGYKVEADRLALEREKEQWNAHLAVTEADISEKDLLQDIVELKAAHPDKSVTQRWVIELRRQLTRIVTNTEQYKEYAAAQAAKALADQKASSDNRAAASKRELEAEKSAVTRKEAFVSMMLQKIRELDCEDREDRERLLRQGSVGSVLPFEGPKYALDDAKILALLKQRYLGGYTDCAMSIEQRKAFNQNYDIDEQKIAYLHDVNNAQNPHQVGRRVGRNFTWRVLCRERGKPHWDESLDTRVWRAEDFWPLTADFLPMGFFGGVLKGQTEAEEAFQDGLSKEPSTSSGPMPSDKTGSSAGPSASRRPNPEPAPQNTAPPPQNQNRGPENDRGSDRGQHRAPGLERSKHRDKGRKGRPIGVPGIGSRGHGPPGGSRPGTAFVQNAEGCYLPHEQPHP